MAANENLQHYPNEMHAPERPGAGEFSRHSRRLLAEVRELGSISLVEGRHRTARARVWLEVAVRAHPLRGVIVALLSGVALGYLIWAR